MKKAKLLILPLLLVSACSTRNSLTDKTIVIGCSPTPHAEILEAVKPQVEKEGYKLKIEVIQDYVTPNTLLNEGDLDANYFQHVPYLDDFNAKNNTNITWITKVHFEPMGIYSYKHSDLNSTTKKIAIPNDVSNGKRARDLLSKYNMEGEIIEMEAQAIPSVLHDVDYGVINGNYALAAMIADRCIAAESSDSETALTNANVIAITQKSLEKDYGWISVLKKVMTSDETREFINTHFGSAVKAVF